MRNRRADGIARIGYERKYTMLEVHSKSRGFRALAPFTIKYDAPLPVDLDGRNIVNQRIMTYVKSRQMIPQAGQIQLTCKYKQIVTIRGKPCVATGLRVYITVNQEKKCIMVDEIHTF
jgi:hypothetical protein